MHSYKIVLLSFWRFLFRTGLKKRCTMFQSTEIMEKKFIQLRKEISNLLKVQKCCFYNIVDNAYCSLNISWTNECLFLSAHERK